MKNCDKCLKTKPKERFSDGRKACKDCRNIQKRKLSCRSGDGLRKYNIMRLYKLTINQYDSMLRAQNGVCKICCNNDNGPWGRLAVDHCHETGKVRGLLCAKCNKGLGQFNDDVNIMTKVIKYLTDK